MAFIECINLSKEYRLPSGQKIVALDNISFRLDRGEFVSLVGPSGAGKSTLARLLLREELPSKGKIVVAGRDIAKLKNKELPYYRRKVGVVFQDFKLLPQKTVYENVAFALEVCEAPDAEIQKKVPQILEMVGLAKRASNYPHELSGGEKQRVAIARAMVGSPAILMADEPTGNLDPLHSREIVDLLLKINQANTSVILATHNSEIVNHLKKRVVSLKDGRVASDEKVGKYAIAVSGNK